VTLVSNFCGFSNDKRGRDQRRMTTTAHLKRLGSLAPGRIDKELSKNRCSLTGTASPLMPCSGERPHGIAVSARPYVKLSGSCAVKDGSSPGRLRCAPRDVEVERAFNRCAVAVLITRPSAESGQPARRARTLSSMRIGVRRSSPGSHKQRSN
jgi:hypothetical protein